MTIEFNELSTVMELFFHNDMQIIKYISIKSNTRLFYYADIL